MGYTHILDIKPFGNGKKASQGQKVIVEYFDSDKNIFETKIDDFWRVTVTREIIPKKYNITPKQLIEELRKKYAGHFFQAMPYGTIKNNFKNTSFDLPIDSEKSFIIWHKGNREDAENLEYTLHNKQIFFKTPKKKFRARTKIIFDTDYLLSLKEVLLNNIDDLFDEDVIVQSNHLEVLCENSTLEKLDPQIFRINTYNSEYFDSEKKLDEFYEKILSRIKNSRLLNPNIDIKDKISYFDRKNNKNLYYVKITSTLDNEVDKLLSSMNFKKRLTKTKQERSARILTYDPLLLSTASKQLREFFPINSTFNSSIPLKMQPNYRIYPFLNVKSFEDPLSIDTCVKNCTNFYLENTAVIDLEVIDYKKNVIPSGRIFMATLKSRREDKLYITKEAWHNSIFREKLMKKYANVKFIFVEDEIDIVSKLEEDASKYYKILGHNFKDYDQRHLIKFNNPSLLFKQDSIDKSQYEKIKGILNTSKLNNSKLKKLWSKTLDDILDTKEYVKRRVNLFADHKLATFAGFTKGMDYDEIDAAIKSKTYNGLDMVVNYTINDGVKNWEFVEQMMKNAVLESVAVNKPLDSVFNSEPVKNFYDAGQRRYFMRLNTLRDRHEMSPKRHLNKLKSRMRPEEIFHDLISDIGQVYGEQKGYMYYADVMIESFKEIIIADPVLQYIYERMCVEKNIILKADLIWKLSSSLLVPIDKARNYMDLAGKKFGKHYELGELHSSLKEEYLEDQYDKYHDVVFINDKNEKDLSRISYIFNQEYLGKKNNKSVRGLIYDETILNLNNILAKNLENFRKFGYVARSESYVVNDILSEDYPGYLIGEMRMINLEKDKFIGKIMSENIALEIYQGVGKYKIKKDSNEGTKLMAEYISIWMNTPELLDSAAKREFIDRIYALPYDEQINPKNRLFIKTIFGIDPLKSKGTLSLFN